MAINFSSQGSQSGNAFQGLLGNNTTQGFNTNAFSSAPKISGLTLPPTDSQGLVAPPTQNPLTGRGQPATLPTPPQPPTAGIIKPTTPVKKITTPDGTTQEFHKPDSTTTPPPVTPPAPGTNFQQNLGGVLAASNVQNNPQYQALEEQNRILNTGATESARAGGAGGFGNTLTPAESGILGPNYVAQFNPNASPEVIAAEKASESPYLSGAIAGNAAEQANMIQAGQLATQGAENVAGLTAPQPTGPTTAEYLPGQNKFAQTAGAAGGAAGLSGIGALQQQQQQGADVQTMTSSLGQTSSLINKAKQDIKTANFNPDPIQLGNFARQWIAGNAVSDPQYANVINDLSEIANTIAPVLGTPGNPTNMKTIIAQELVPRLLQGQDIGTVLDNLEQNAQLKINSAKTASQTNAVTSQESGGVSAGGYNYKQVNGKWVPA